MALTGVAAGAPVHQEVIMHDTDVGHPGRDDPDDVQGASNDSFPASDPPSWMGMRVGGPPRAPATSKFATGQGDRPMATDRIERAESPHLM